MKIEEQLNAEIALTMAWLEDTLQPAVDILNIKHLAEDIKIDLQLFESKKGKTDASTKSMERVNAMLGMIERLDKIATQNNTFQLIAKHSQLKQWQLEQENSKLKQELEAIKKAFEAE